jgi:hypothetical protein
MVVTLVRAAARTTHTFSGEGRGKTVKKEGGGLWSMVKGGGGSMVKGFLTHSLSLSGVWSRATTTAL